MSEVHTNKKRSLCGGETIIIPKYLGFFLTKVGCIPGLMSSAAL